MPRPGRKERPKRIIHLMSRSTRRRRALVFAGVGASHPRLDCLIADPSSLWTPSLVSLGVFVDVDRQESWAKVTKVSSHAHVFDSMSAFQPVRFELHVVSRDCQPSLPLLSLSLSLSLLFLPHNTSLCTQRTYTAETWNRVVRRRWSCHAAPFPGCSQCTCTTGG